MRTTISDDFIPLIAISLGAVMSATATVSLLLPDATPPAVESIVVAPRPVVVLEPVVPSRPVVVRRLIAPPRRLVDFAITREYAETGEYGEIMVGPEDARTGWNRVGTARYPGGMIQRRR